MGAFIEEEQPFLPLRSGGGGAASGPRAASRERGRSRTCHPCLECCCVTLVLAVVAVAFGALCWFVGEYFGPATPQYSVEIASVSGLDPATDLHAGAALDPVFNLTVGVASKGLYCGVCIQPRTAVKVSYSYLGLPLAGGRVPEVCAGPKEPTEKRTVIARGVGVSVPGYLLDSLAEDVRSGEAVFEVKLIEGDDDRGSRTVATCWARVGGGLDDRCV